LVHNIILSMPKHTDPEKLQRAASVFARENFALSHRYAYALHTDTDHPHVHLVVKAASEQGKRLRINKAALRAWRESFAEQLRVQGVSAAATPAQLRGRASGHVSDGAYRLAARIKRPKSIQSLSAVRHSAQQNNLHHQSARRPAVTSRRIVSSDWDATLATLRTQGATALALEVMTYLQRLKTGGAVESLYKEPVQKGSEPSRH
jgi:hypothetical protein